MGDLSTLARLDLVPRLPKRDRTRRKLIDAGYEVLAERGAALTASDVVNAAEVSNGTFYNHFVDREDFLDTLARESLEALADVAAAHTEGQDPAWRFAVATTRLLNRVVDDPLWGRVILRLAESPRPTAAAVQRHLRSDLAEGRAQGRFAFGDDPVTLDLVTGTLMASIHRITRTGAGTEAVAPVVTRLLVALGLAPSEAEQLATSAARPAGPTA
jgi:AcrR family transcriptional regulator